MGRSRKRKKKPAHAASRPMVKVELAALELAAGHDGFLRGEPEPVVLLAALWLTERVHHLGRTAVHFGAIERYPSTITPTAGATLLARLPGPGRLVILAIALEEDTGADVARVYGLVESVGALRFWASGPDVPEPVPVEALPLRAEREPVALPIHVLDGPRDLGDRCSADTFVGAWAIGVPADGVVHDVRVRFTSADRKNDWTASLVVTAARA